MSVHFVVRHRGTVVQIYVLMPVGQKNQGTILLRSVVALEPMIRTVIGSDTATRMSLLTELVRVGVSTAS